MCCSSCEMLFLIMSELKLKEVFILLNSGLYRFPLFRLRPACSLSWSKISNTPPALLSESYLLNKFPLNYSLLYAEKNKLRKITLSDSYMHMRLFQLTPNLRITASEKRVHETVKS